MCLWLWVPIMVWYDIDIAKSFVLLNHCAFFGVFACNFLGVKIDRLISLYLKAMSGMRYFHLDCSLLWGINFPSASG